ncbi:SurA N-terminal domain-containing protein [Poseidonocella sedimentorum]|uniref:Peptidyl-prolyl cis-trans isomerase D n=1 Tax=Poseidonocella sedimentorum TaxID=871652 RepID=A0A1I6DFF3_9RHOB|nr:SurA N-terminal domain-containing protein [Poseidonocella sedimentorum]SFR04091.1 peptidyl-prolyl cis-trans isomerase D [Poseidonocella sedimentorum]
MASGKVSNYLVYILLGLLIVGLMGFGASGLSGTVRSVGKVGGEPISIEAYGRDLTQIIRGVESQTGTALSFQDAQAQGLDRVALARSVTAKALEVEAAELGLSVSDETVRDELLTIPAFRRSDGGFDRDAYGFALQNNGMTEAEFEERLRSETARGLVQSAIAAGIEIPQTYTDTLLAHLGERRSYTFAWLEPAMLDAPLPEPDEEVLRAFYADAEDAFQLPERKRLTYVWLLPEMIVGDVELDEAALRDSYETRIDEFVQPERRLVERLVFATGAEAESAADRIAAGETIFEGLVAARGLDLADVDLGDVTREDLAAAGDPVFAAEDGAVTGPHPSNLGPALFRVNGIIEASETSFEDALPFLREDLAMDRARRQIEARISELEDQLAAGATLEDLAAEGGLEQGQIDWYDGLATGIAAYDAFGATARAVTEQDYPEIQMLEDGGIFALRLDEVVPAAKAPFEDVADEVRAAWELAEAETRLLEMAETLRAALENGSSFEDLGLAPQTAADQTRRDFAPDVPTGLLVDLFAAEPGAIIVTAEAGRAAIARLDAVEPHDPEDPDLRQISTLLSQQASQAISSEVFGTWMDTVQRRLGVQIDQQALNAVHANFR